MFLTSSFIGVGIGGLWDLAQTQNKGMILMVKGRGDQYGMSRGSQNSNIWTIG
jgi:hypothetical protein